MQKRKFAKTEEDMIQHIKLRQRPRMWKLDGDSIQIKPSISFGFSTERSARSAKNLSPQSTFVKSSKDTSTLDISYSATRERKFGPQSTEGSQKT